jgi:cytochrome d ubiquinol oxidase subunit I
MKGVALRRGAAGAGGAAARWDAAADFWIRIFGLNFALGVATGIPMEFQFGTNWGAFARFAGGVVGQTLAMEGLFAFFLESSFVALLVFGRRRLGARGHFLAAVALFVGSWLSGYFIVTTNAFLQHPVGYTTLPDGRLALSDFWAFLLNPWGLVQYAHTLLAALVTGAFVVTAVGAYWTLSGRHAPEARATLRVGVVLGLVATLGVAFPTGDAQAKLVARHQPATLAAMEGRFESGSGAAITLIGQPNVQDKRLDNPVEVPAALSFIAYGHFGAFVRGLDEFPQTEWPTNIELLYYAFHVMVGLGTIMSGLMAIAALFLWRKKLEATRPLLWTLMLAVPFPYIANTAGWLTTELGRQPWLIYGLFRTEHGSSPTVHSGDALFTLIGFAGLYLLLGLLYMALVLREIGRGPAPPSKEAA